MAGQVPEPKYYAVCANHVSFELLLVENPQDILEIYLKFIDSEILYQNNREKFKSIYNILNRRDGLSLNATTKIK